MIDKIKDHFRDRNYTDMDKKTEAEMLYAFGYIPAILFVAGLLYVNFVM